MQAISPSFLIGSAGDSLRETFGKTLVAIAGRYPEMVVLDADIAGGTGVHHFRRHFPGRFFQFGIAEQNMMAVAGGMAAIGLIPVVTTFAVFCLRALEQARLSVAYCRRNVKIVASHPGLDVGPDGASAQCLEDLAAFRAMPNVTVVVPADQREVEQATEAIFSYHGPVYMRTGRSPAPRILPDDYQFRLGKGRILRKGQDVAIMACGVMVARAMAAAEILAERGTEAMVVNFSTIKPLDWQLVAECATHTGCVVTCEDHNIYGGLGSAVAECLVRTVPVPQEFVAVDDRFGQSGEPDELAVHYRLHPEAIAAAAEKAVARKNGHG
ncbi:MAG: transketolase family protein [Negativicutes bacterium]|nr:transketolase family protein [Negativicutes bacterium]